MTSAMKRLFLIAETLVSNPSRSTQETGSWMELGVKGSVGGSHFDRLGEFEIVVLSN